MGIYRNRRIYAVYIVLVIVLGLASRRFGGVLPDFLSAYLGDVLWGLMVFLMSGFLMKKKSSLRVGAIAMLTAALVELSQLYHAPWIEDIRSTRLGGLILGYSFLWSDLACYAVGIAFGVILELCFTRKNIRGV